MLSDLRHIPRLLVAFVLLFVAGSKGLAQTRGTSDGGGGGNGVENQVYEAYIVDPLQLPAYKKFLAPIFENLGGRTASGTKNSIWRWSDFFKIKTWYIAPHTLNPLSKDVLGITFTPDQTQQMALQKDRQIWIDKKIYDKMTEKDQALLILHEYVMMMYLLKYKSIKELCKISESMTGKLTASCASAQELPGYEEPRPLDASDVEKIHQMTFWLWQNGGKEKTTEIFHQFLLHDFDSRLFASYVNSAKNDEHPIDISAEEVQEIFESASLLNRAPSECQGLNSSTKINCVFKVKLEEGVFNNYPIKSLRVRAKSASNLRSKPILDLALFMNGTMHASLLTDLVTKEVILLVPLSNTPSPQSLAKGNTFRTNFLIAKKVRQMQDEKWELHSVLSILSVVTKVETANGLKKCSSDQPVPRDIYEDTIVLAFPNADTRYLKWFANALRGISPPCW